MVMIMTVIPVNQRSAASPCELTQAFNIEDPAGLSLEERLMTDGALDQILHFLCRCHRRFDDVVGETVLLVDFREAVESDDFDSGDPRLFCSDFAPSLN